MDLRRIRLQARQIAGIPDIGDPMVSDVFLNDSANAALAMLSGDRPWEWLTTSAAVTITSGIGTLPTDFGEAQELTVTISGQTLPVRRGSFATVAIEKDADRYVWDVVANQLQVNPTNTTALSATLYYTRTEPQLAADAQEPLAPDYAHQYLVYKTAQAIKERKSDFDQAGYFRGRADDELDKLRKRPSSGRKLQPVAIKSYADSVNVTYATWS